MRMRLDLSKKRHLRTGLFVAVGLAAFGPSVAGAAAPGLTITAKQDIAAAGQTKSTAFCGTKPITLGIEDGLGTNAWSQESMTAVRSEAAKCKNVKTIVDIGQGNLQTVISQVDGMASQGAKAIVVIPDFGAAEIPAMQKATSEGVKVVAWAAPPGGTPGTDYDTYVDWNQPAAGTAWANWLVKADKGHGNILMLGGPAGNPNSAAIVKAAAAVFAKHPGMKLLLGNKGYAVTNWDPATAQQVMGSLLAKYPKIDGIIADYGTVALAGEQALKAAHRPLVPVASLDTNGMSCLYKADHKSNPNFQIASTSDHNWMGRVAARHAIAAAEGVKDNEPSIFDLSFWENTLTGPAKCEANRSPSFYDSNQLSPALIAKYGKG
jgi:ribose transport system substrate-binding protein